MGQLRKNTNSVRDIKALKENIDYYGLAMKPEEFISLSNIPHNYSKRLQISNQNLTSKIKSFLNEDVSHNKTDDVHTMNLLYLSFRKTPSRIDIELMKLLQGLEQQTILIDDVIDNPNSKDKNLKTATGFMLYQGLNKQFYNIIQKTDLPLEEQLTEIKNWNDLGSKIYHGQSLDVLNTKNNKLISFEEYIGLIYLTTASFTEYAMRLSAKTNKQTRQLENIASKIGKNIGLEFQIRDDFQDMEKDLHERKQRIFSVRECPKQISDKKYLKANPIEKIRYAQSPESQNFVKEKNRSYLEKARELTKSLPVEEYRKKINAICDLLEL